MGRRQLQRDGEPNILACWHHICPRTARRRRKAAKGLLILPESPAVHLWASLTEVAHWAGRSCVGAYKCTQTLKSESWAAPHFVCLYFCKYLAIAACPHKPPWEGRGWQALRQQLEHTCGMVEKNCSSSLLTTDSNLQDIILIVAI